MGRRVGLIYDDRMCTHSSPDEDDHPENPNRIQAIWERLNESGLVQRCVVLDAKKAEDNHLALVHSRKHINLIKTISSRSSRTMSNTAEKFDSIYFNVGSSTAAYLAAGSVIEVAERVAQGELDSAFAVVRPPGHHAEQDKPMGFCLCNNVAIATSFLLNERPELGIRKILVVDWDIHHGNGTQKMFYDDPRVLVFSVHRHESGRFYPHSTDGSYNMIGEGPGAGFNINVPWENGGCGDADYVAVWDHILIPVAKEFDPDMIIVSAGFDAAKDDPIGGCCVTPYGYMIMLDKLMGFARGKIVMALEGGYNPVSLTNSTQSCLEVLLEEKPVISSLKDVPLKSTGCVIRAVRQALCRYWPALAPTLPDNLINTRPSHIDAPSRKRKRMPESIPITGKGKAVVVGEPGDGETSSSEGEKIWNFECAGDQLYDRPASSGPTLSRDCKAARNLAQRIALDGQFTGDHRELFSQSTDQLMDDIFYAIQGVVMPRVVNLGRRSLTFAERKARYEKMARAGHLGMEHENVKKTLEEREAAWQRLDERHKKLKAERNRLRDDKKDLTQQLTERDQQLESVKKELADLQGQVADLETRVAWDAVLKFVRSKAFGFAANVHCFANAKRFFWKSVGQLIKLGMVPPSARTDDRLRMDLDENLEPIVETGDPADNLTEPEYNDLVTMLQDEFMAANSIEPEVMVVDEGDDD